MASGSDDLADMLAYLQNRPFDFVYWAFPWAEADGELAKYEGPDVWQAATLLYMQERLLAGDSLESVLQIAVRSGHGVGKTGFLSWVIIWAVSTFVDTRGRVTANTEKQLRTILWAEVAKWHRLFIAKHMFKMTATSLYSSDPEHEKTWRIDAIPWSEDNPEAFAGLHNHGKRIIIVFDEGSGIADNIWETVDGATTDEDTQIIWLVASNPTKNYGRYRDCFDRLALDKGGVWYTVQVDSRTSRFSNKTLIEKWVKAWGEDSDFIKVRVRGDFPDQSMLQLIPVELIRAAMQRPAVAYQHEALILSVDVARFGDNESVASWRLGKDGKSKPFIRRRGLSVVECADWVAGLIALHQPDATMVDEGGVGGGVVDLLRTYGHPVIAVNFGSKPGQYPGGVKVLNKRAEMYVALRDWLREGGALPDDEDLFDQLVGIEYSFNKQGEIKLMAKEDMRLLSRASPDMADSLAMSFAFPVAKRAFRRLHTQGAAQEYDPLGERALHAVDRYEHGPAVGRATLQDMGYGIAG